MIVPGDDLKYDVVLGGDWLLGDITQSITIEDSLEEASVRATVNILVPEDGFPGIAPGQSFDVIGYPFSSRSERISFLPTGVVWACASTKSGTKSLIITAYDHLIYMLKSEDEEMFKAGQTATQRLQYLANKWGIPTNSLPNTGVQLSSAVRRAMTLYRMVHLDLYETVLKGGDIYRLRMTNSGLNLFRLGSNDDIWMLELDQNVISVTQTRTLDGAATRVKVLGKKQGNSTGAIGESALDPVIAVESKDVDKYGLLQKVVTIDGADDGLAPSEVAKTYLAGMQESFTAECIDINTVWAGDKIYLNGVALYVISVSRNLGSPGTMHLELGSLDYIRRRFYDRYVQPA